MKKAIVLLLAVLISTSICFTGCSNNQSSSSQNSSASLSENGTVQKELVGEWGYFDSSTDTPQMFYLSFKADGTFYSCWFLDYDQSKKDLGDLIAGKKAAYKALKGTYTIDTQSKEIIFSYLPPIDAGKERENREGKGSYEMVGNEVNFKLPIQLGDDLVLPTDKYFKDSIFLDCYEKMITEDVGVKDLMEKYPQYCVN